jgi:hypothetical protein
MFRDKEAYIAWREMGIAVSGASVRLFIAAILFDP